MAKMGGCARVLDLVDALRLSSHDISLPGVVLFLRVCEHDGISVKELVYRSGYSESLVSRAVDRLCGVGASARLKDFGGALVSVVRHPDDGRRRLVYLTDAGRALKGRIERLLSGQPDEV